MKAGQLMTQPVVTVNRATSLAEVAKIMVDRRIGCVAVVDQAGTLCGIVTQTDFAANERATPFSMEDLARSSTRLPPDQSIERVRQGVQGTTAQEIMITEVITGQEDTPVEEVARQMLRYNIDHVPIVRDGVPVGIVSRHDFLRMIAQAAEPS